MGFFVYYSVDFVVATRGNHYILVGSEEDENFRCGLPTEDYKLASRDCLCIYPERKISKY